MRATNSALVVQTGTNSAESLTNDIRGIKPPVEIPSGWEWLWWTLGAIAVVVALVFLWRWWRKRLDRPEIVPVIPPHLRAKQRLHEALRLIGDPRLFCIAVSDALRWYLEERFHLRAPERTTEESLQDLQRTEVLNAEQKLSLTDFLERCDLVKFAKFEPTEAALRDLHDSALRLVDETQYESVKALVGGEAGKEAGVANGVGEAKRET
ncbi:MAG: hypothetical protein HZA90_28865 [Verrucomicrobia bacterium]|nr:hypothetical protein [Verrucomicrobiota bacterium]